MNINDKSSFKYSRFNVEQENSVKKDEIFDVVDADDQVIGNADRSYVHRKRLFHRAVHIFVFNKANELYLQRRSKNKDTAQDKWVSSCSGHVNSGEDYDTAARRELTEEIGLSNPGYIRRVLKETPCEQTGFEFVWVYICQAEGPFELDPVEVSDGQWCEIKYLSRWLSEKPQDFAYSFSYLWAKYKAVLMNSKKNKRII